MQIEEEIDQEPDVTYHSILTSCHKHNIRTSLLISYNEMLWYAVLSSVKVKAVKYTKKYLAVARQ